MTISMERARECVGRPVIGTTDDDEERNGVIQYVGRSYIKVLFDGQEDGWVMSEDKLTWKALLPDDTRSAITSWYNDESYDDHWAVVQSDTSASLIVQWREGDEEYQDHFLLSADMQAVYRGHHDADFWIAREIQELRGWAQP